MSRGSTSTMLFSDGAGILPEVLCVPTFWPLTMSYSLRKEIKASLHLATRARPRAPGSLHVNCSASVQTQPVLVQFSERHGILNSDSGNQVNSIIRRKESIYVFLLIQIYF
jgi:hypothetical protein